MTEKSAYSSEIVTRIEAHRRFWGGEGPSLIFISRGETQLYDMSGYVERFEQPRLMFQFEVGRAQALHDWPTDGIPAVRPSLGTVFIPAIAGQDYQVTADQMPWPGKRLGREQIRRVSAHMVSHSPMYRKAEEFYRYARGSTDFVAYHADTQGVFDIAHILYGEDLFMEMAMAEDEQWVRELLDVSLELYITVSDRLKADLAEGRTEMIHGHGTPQGLYFPNAGVRISEDTATLISPDMIEKFLVPVIHQSMEPYGGGFVHYCGRHEFLFQRLCSNSLVRAIDLGNPEMYDLDYLAETAGRTGTVLYTRVAALEGEGWEAYLRRVAGVMNAHGTRCVLRPMVFPADSAECREMLDMWHHLTG